ncbi:MAG TPA: hypothetical protein QF650_02050 [Vicinamibacterales bacterium]|nr:hypothetical protein [Acidobacteriota bacterium]MDP7472944.1 hypothetical protein [Vicinamibacterales bacterium]HJO37366.1 hypothetical protein [Vicinamibacterales bacterium]
MSQSTPDVRKSTYSPRLRTALVLTGTGTAGAYHAGVLRALQEAGVKIDLVAGRGMGAVSAMFAAVDGGSTLWGDGGIWRGDPPPKFYHWRASLRAATGLFGATVVTVLFPLIFLVAAALVYPVAFALRLVGGGAGTALADRYGEVLTVMFGPGALPTLVPRTAVGLLLALLVLLGATALRALRSRRRGRGAVWWQMLAVPLTATDVRDRFARALWQLIRGASAAGRPAGRDASQGYTELLAENLGQPGFRELVVTAHDVDIRRDLVFALLSAPYRERFFQRTPESGRRASETWDLAGSGRDHALDALAAAVSLPVVTEPHLITFAPDSHWRGETHRAADRADAIARLLEEVLNAGVEQVVVVSATAELTAPHTLSAGRRDARGRAGEYQAAMEAAAVRDAVTARVGHFSGLFLIRPTHNPVGPFDFSGAYDERSDRKQTVAELVDRGHQDAYRQFVDPVVAASGERLRSVN